MDLFSTLQPLVQSKEAIYIAERVVLSSYIVDLRIIAASDAAARLFGHQQAADLEGQYVSLLHNDTDLINSRQWAYLRHVGEPTPDNYVMRIRRQDGEEAPVRKRVLETTISQKTVWISKNELVRGPHTLLEAPLLDVSEEAMRSWWGNASLREAEIAIQEKYGLTTSLHKTRIHSMDLSNSGTVSIDAIRQLDVPGPNRYFQYYCFHCHQGWVSRGEPDTEVPHQPPSRCNYCRRKNWDKPT